MIQPLQNQAGPTKTNWTLGILALALLAGAMTTLLFRGLPAKPRVETTIPTPVATSRTNLTLVAGHLCLVGQTNPFAGIMIEHFANGSLRSRSAVTNGLLHGLSEGWHTNGQLQVSECFREGVSHGLRTKWYPYGTRLSEATIVNGRLHGPFRRWQVNGALAEEVEMHDGQPHGTAKSYFSNGSLKSEYTLQNGTVVEQKFRGNDDLTRTTAVTATNSSTEAFTDRAGMKFDY